MLRADDSVTHWQILPILAIPNQISLISMLVSSLVKIPWHLHKLSSGNENMGMPRADNSVKIWWNLPISNPKPDVHNINAHTKFGENPVCCLLVIIWKWNTEGRTDIRQMDRHTDAQCETIIPCHYLISPRKHTLWVLIRSASARAASARRF